VKLMISRKIWLRGEGPSNSKLLRTTDQKMCCLGILLEQSGVDRAHLADRGSPAGIFHDMPDLPVAMRFLAFNRQGERDDTTVCRLLININDTRVGSIAEVGVFPGHMNFLMESEQLREAKITEIFAPQGITVQFID
jgi:hypothetical protein